jgi:signal recognition particle subunit SRP19
MSYQQPRIEELPDSDSDPSDMDPSDFMPAPSSKQNTTLMSASNIPSAATGNRPIPFRSAGASGSGVANPPQIKTWACLYPVYFDSSRTRAEGRRVQKALAVANPLATEIADAVKSLGLWPRLEVTAAHPKDWANVGRVRVQLKDADTGARLGGSAGVKNKHHLYRLVAKYLQAHPTTESTPLRLPIVPGEKVEVKPPPAVPKGWKINAILPLHSPAVKGHGVTDNPLKEAMAQLGQGPDLGAGSSEGGESKKKKKEKKR